MKKATSIIELKDCKLNSLSEQSKTSEFNTICSKYELSMVVVVSTLSFVFSD
jgi:hypothetical protein